MSERTAQQWAEWFEEFKRRHGLTPERVEELTRAPTVPVPAPSSKPPPKPHNETDREDES